jgi:hypothetical protein
VPQPAVGVECGLAICEGLGETRAHLAVFLARWIDAQGYGCVPGAAIPGTTISTRAIDGESSADRKSSAYATTRATVV